ncbi:hypothetical protein [Ralstonia solanacearum]|uniref:hypothetical protein n=1 Tax=Ralstonia solanacearum TaxID=305 RepID=UPI001E4B47E4|nr:hypothetical protein [Ralstonia solanacearum]
MMAIMVSGCSVRYEFYNYVSDDQETPYGDLSAKLIGTSVARDEEGRRLNVIGNPYKLFIFLNTSKKNVRKATVTRLELSDNRTGGSLRLASQSGAAVAGRGNVGQIISFSYFQLNVPDVKNDVRLSGEVEVETNDEKGYVAVPIDMVLKSSFSAEEKNILQRYWDGLMGV